MNLHARTTPGENHHHRSWIERLALNIGDDIVLEVDDQGDYWLNGEANSGLPASLDGVEIEKYTRCTEDGSSCEEVFEIDFGTLTFEVYEDEQLLEEISFDNEYIEIILFHGHLDVNSETILVNGGFLGKLETPGFAARDGITVLDKVSDFVAEWQVDPSKGDPLLFHELHDPVYPMACMTPQEYFDAQEGETPQQRRRRLGDSNMVGENQAIPAEW